MEDRRFAAETHLAMLGVKIAGTAFRVLTKKDEVAWLYCATSLFGGLRMKVKQKLKKGKIQIVELLTAIADDHVGAFAAQSAFFFILSFIPFLMVFISLVKYTSITQEMLVQVMRDFSPAYIEEFLTDIVSEVYSNSLQFLSITVVMAIWSSAKGAQSLLNGLNAVYRVKETRNWFIVRFWAVVYTLMFILSIIISLLLVAFGANIQKLIPDRLSFLQKMVNGLIQSRMIILLIILITFFLLILNIFPNRKASFRSQLPGAIFSAIGWYFSTFLISIYVDDFNGFSIYGSLTTWVLVMIWLYFCMYILLIGGKINVAYGAIMEQHLENKKISKKNGSIS